jgi:hypothetical protein
MQKQPSNDPVEVFAGTPWQAGMVKTLLENAGITAFIQNEIMGTYNPWWTAPGGAGALSVFVSETDLEEALEIVKGYEKNLVE